MKNPLFILPFVLALPLPAQGDHLSVEHVRAAASTRTGWPFARVVHDGSPDGRLWACGASWKASFGRDGFTYLPRLGAAAPSCPVQFQLAAVRVGGRPLALGDGVMPVRDGDVVSFQRGPVREFYVLGLEQVEQGFVVDTADAGDVEVELRVATSLVERAEEPGLQFANEHGEVGYGDAFLRRGAELVPIATTWNGETLRLRVAAAQRGAGPVVIDPILTTRTASATGPMQSPDISYDPIRQRYLLVWEVNVSNNDHDVFSEQFDAAGDPIPGSLAPIEISGLFASHPRCAFLAAGDAWLVAFSLTDPNVGNRRMVFSRRVDGPTMLVGPYERLSNPNLPGDNDAPEIGADPATDPATPHDWLVVWTHFESATDANVHGRAVLANGQPKHSWVLVIEDEVDTINRDVQVSRSNGNGHVPHPMWFVVYSRRISSTVEKIYGRTLDLAFVRGAEEPVEVINQANRHPRVSSPIASGGRSAFFVTYERGTAALAMGVVIAFDPAPAWSQAVDVTAQFGMTGELTGVASDGVRFVAVCKDQQTNNLAAYTFALAGGLVLQDGPWLLGGAGTASTPAVVALRDSGGPVANYAIAWMQTNILGPIRVVRYAGQQLGPTTQIVGTQCHGLGIQHAGTSALGDSMQFTLSNPGADFPGFAFGATAANPIPICAQCSLGLRLDVPISLAMGSTTFAVGIPAHAGLVGQSFAVQGLGIGPWSCFGALRFSDTVAFTIR